MVIRNSSKILEQLSDIEELIQKVEHYFDEKDQEVEAEEEEEAEAEEDLGEVIENWEARHSSQLQSEN